MVDGDLVELDPAILKALRGEISRVDGICRIPEGLGGPAARAIHNRHVERQKAQAPLRRAIQLWAGYQRDQGCSDREIHRLFFLTFGTDVMTAQTLGRAGSWRISHGGIGRRGVDGSGLKRERRIVRAPGGTNQHPDKNSQNQP
jgi:hypothetical protein